MKGWLAPIALGLVLALVALSAVTLLRPGAPVTAAERTDALAQQLRCPDCEGLSVADSPSASAREIRRQIADLVAGGASDDAVRDHFVARYGQWILLAPTSPAVWIMPFAVVVVGLVGLGWWLARRRPRVPTPGDRPAVSEEERKRLRDELEALDA
jgi:cytochrome c-type biogenesis protein CcmH